LFPESHEIFACGPFKAAEFADVAATKAAVAAAATDELSTEQRYRSSEWLVDEDEPDDDEDEDNKEEAEAEDEDDDEDDDDDDNDEDEEDEDDVVEEGDDEDAVEKLQLLAGSIA
jgi:hypothetical protein